MRILVTGGSGFIGSHVIDLLLADGHEVTNFDLVPSLYADSSVRYIQGDIRHPETLTKAFQGMDAIYHLAAEANVNRYFDAPVVSTDVNTMGVIYVLEAARANQVKRVLLASTEWVYGGCKELEVDEDTPLLSSAPDHLYTSSKVAAELYCQNYQRLYGVPYTIIRFGIPFGERARPETVTPIFLRKAFKGETIELHGNPNQFRQFINVKDLARGNVACLSANAENQIININGAEKIRLVDIVSSIEKVLDRKLDVKMSNDRAGNFAGRVVSSRKAHELLGWKQTMSYQEGLAGYVAWFKKNCL